MASICRTFSIFLIISLFAFSSSVPIFTSPISAKDSTKFGEYHENSAGRFKRMIGAAGKAVKHFWPLATSGAVSAWLTKKGIESQIAGGYKFDPSTVFEDFGVPVPEKKGEDERHLRVTLRLENRQENNGVKEKKNRTNQEE